MLTWGRLWDLTTPRSASSGATVLDAMDVPLSEWMVSWAAGTPSAAMVSASRASARAALSRVATIQPTALPE